MKEFARQRRNRKEGFGGEGTLWARAKRRRMSEFGEVRIAQQGKGFTFKEEQESLK